MGVDIPFSHTMQLQPPQASAVQQPGEHTPQSTTKRVQREVPTSKPVPPLWPTPVCSGLQSGQKGGSHNVFLTVHVAK